MSKHSFSNTQVEIPGWHADALRRLGKKIPDGELAEDGRENESHITVKYGLSDEKPSTKLKEALTGFGPVTATFGKTSLFQNDDADVVKVDIESPDLRRLNALIGKTVETPGNTHPDYTPHATIAYVKPGNGKKYEGDKTLHGQKLTFDSVIFSGKNGHRESIPLIKSRYRRYLAT